MEEASSPLDEIKGEKLTSVRFVHDYIQLDFDGVGMSLYNPVVITASGKDIKSGGEGFRDAICNQIGKRTFQILWRKEQELVLVFTDRSRIAVSLKEKDYSGPEAVACAGKMGQILSF